MYVESGRVKDNYKWHNVHFGDNYSSFCRYFMVKNAEWWKKRKKWTILIFIKEMWTWSRLVESTLQQLIYVYGLQQDGWAI